MCVYCAGFASYAFVGLATAGLASEEYVGLATVGLLTATASFATDANGIKVTGPQGGAAIIHLSADEDDDDIDRFRFKVENGGPFKIENQASGSFETNIECAGNGSVDLYYDNVKKFETTGYGVSVTGISSAISFSGSASGLTNIPSGQLTGALPAIDGSALTGLTGSQLTGALPAIDGSALTGLTGASAGTYGDASTSARITVDANGRITGITTAAISGGGGGGSSTLAGLSDVTITTPSSNQVLLWNGANWVNAASPGGGGGVSEALAIAYAIAL